MATIPSVRLSRGALATAVSAAVAGSVAPGALAQDMTGIEEVTVTARKRVENIQDVPQAVLAFSARDLAKQGITSLEDLARFAPAMTVVGSGAGLNKIVFRGLADTLRPFIADSSAAIYLDEQPLTTGSQSPVIRPVDLERIESLAGPQGTLYGASSQSGTVRYIVAKPDPGEFDANVGGGLRQIDQGDLGWDSDVMVNIPVIKDKLAVRLVGFGAKDAGYIDNVAGVTPYASTRTNAGKTGKDFNDADWQGGRISARWLVNDDWAVTGIYNNQHSKTHGFSDFDKSRGDLETVKFVHELWDDAWSNYQFTLDGELGFANLTSTTSYFERDTSYVFDATNNVAYYHASLGAYGRGSCGSDPAAAYYNIYDFATACELNGVGTDFDDGDPIGWFAKDQKDQRWTHETRLTGSTSRLDWTLGFFYQEADQHWVYGTHIENFMRTEAWAAHQTIAALNGRPPLAPTDIRWGSGDHNERKDAAVFGEGTFSLTANWKLLAGARWYKASVDRKYYQRVPGTADPQFVLGDGNEDDLLPKIGFQYVIDDERMLYALYSEGFRLGGVNRDRAEQRGLIPTFPREYKPDILQNWEAGLKSRWIDNRVQLNLTGYHQVWKDMQLETFDPQSGTLLDTDGDGTADTRYPFQRVIANLGDAVVDGFDLDLTMVSEGGLSAGLVSTYLFRAELDDDILVPNPNDPTRQPFFMSAGTRLPLSADLKFSAYLEYGWQVELLGGGEAYARLQYSYTDGSWNQPKDYDGCPPLGSSRCFDFHGNPYPDRNGFGARARQPDYETVDLRTGFSTDLWEFSLYMDNLLDQRVQSYLPYLAATYFGGETIRTTGPRAYGMRVRRHFR